jgi:hypothetical protein
MAGGKQLNVAIDGDSRLRPSNPDDDPNHINHHNTSNDKTDYFGQPCDYYSGGETKRRSTEIWRHS